MTLLAIDIGTTHCKAGLFTDNGRSLRIASRMMVTHQTPEGWVYYDPEEVWSTVAATIQDVTQAQPESIAAIGIASMAETGLLVDRSTGQTRSFFVPWFDPAAQPSAALVQSRSDALECYLKFGLRMNFKCGLAKLLWLLQRNPGLLKDTIWLSAADYAAYRLTGVFGTDYSLACRTFAFRVDRKEWDLDWLRDWGLPPGTFPTAVLSGTPLGGVTPGNILPAGIPVSICGHDHVCGALAGGAIQPGIVFDSMGTAESLLGALPERPLTEADFRIGLLYGCHAVRGGGYWMGGVSASGGSVEWLRSLFGNKPLSYQELDALLEEADPDPTGILYFSYLLGSGSPHTNPYMRGAFIGLSALHGRANLLKAVLEGVAYEVELIRRAGEKMIGQPIRSLVTAGGGTRNRHWLQVKADVSGCQIEALAEPASTLLGAAMVSAIGVGLYAGTAEALSALPARAVEVFKPDAERNAIYKRFFEQGYLALQEPLRRYYSNLPPFSTASVSLDE
ncbi:MAG: carbohydrate kinase [Chloroflexota bacterium]|nr:MAG: carbohydrate kinase [Chloroflexota bacterium]